MVAQGGSGATNETGLPVAGTEWNDWHEDHHDYVRTDLEVMNMPTTNSLTVSYSSITNLIYTYVTNLTVTGEDLDPNIAGTYVEIAPYVDFRRWEGTLGAILSGSYTNNVGNIGVTVGGTYWTWLGTMWTPEGDYTPFPLGGGVPTGTAHVVYDVIETITTNGATPVDYSGTYYPTTAENVWRGGAGYIFITNGSYVIYSSLELNTNEAYLSSGTKLGMYSAVNFTATNIVSAGGGESQPCVGTFTGTPMEPWFMGTWACTNSEGVFTIRDMSDSIISIWVKAGYDTNPVGIYTASGPECFGSVTSALLNVYNDWHEDHHDPVYHTHTWGTNTIFYECWLRKEAPWRTMVTNLYTNIEHRTQFWVYPSGVQAGGFNGIQTNTFNDEDIGFTRENWQSAVIGNWTDWDFETYAVVDDYWTSLLSTPPEMAPEPPVLTVNSRVIDGFYIDRYNFLGVMDWKFQYCTNKYW